MKVFVFLLILFEAFGNANTSTLVPLTKRHASNFLSSKSVEAKHSSSDKESCLTNEYFCEMNHAYCQTEEVYERRCEDCSFFQTCSIDHSSYCLHGTRNDCVGLDPFEQGKGTFAFLLILTFICIGLIIVLIVQGIRKFRQRKNKSRDKKSNESQELASTSGSRNRRVHPQVCEPQTSGVISAYPVQTVDHPPAYPGHRPGYSGTGKGSKKGSGGKRKKGQDIGQLVPIIGPPQQNCQYMYLPMPPQAVVAGQTPPVHRMESHQDEMTQRSGNSEHSHPMVYPVMVNAPAPLYNNEFQTTPELLAVDMHYQKHQTGGSDDENSNDDKQQINDSSESN